MSIIAAGTTSTTALTSTGNTDGTLQFQVNGTTPSVTLNTLGAIGVGSSPSFGTSGQVLVSGGSTVAPAWATPSAVNLASGVTGTLPIANGGTNSTATPTAGTVPYGTGTALAYTAAGSSGQILQSNGASAPSWVAAPGGGSWIYLSTVTASGAATADVETTFNSTYDAYAIVMTGVYPSTDANDLTCRLKVNGTYQVTNYQYCVTYVSAQSSSYIQNSAVVQSSAYLSYGLLSNSPLRQYEAVMFIHNPSGTNNAKIFNLRGSYITYASGSDKVINLSAAGGFYEGGSGMSTAALTGVRFLMTSGNINGTFRLYGIKNS
jgi:hypothetical protein